MDKDKAIQLLERLQDPDYFQITGEAFDAIQMAIDALSADGDTISRTSLMSELKDMHREAEKWMADAKNDDVKARAESCLVTITEIKLRVDEMPSVQPEPSQVAEDIARIVENGQDMRVIAQPEIIFCKDCKKHNKDYHMSPYKDTVCPLTAWRGTAQGHEYDYQFCCFAKRREVTT